MGNYLLGLIARIGGAVVGGALLIGGVIVTLAALTGAGSSLAASVVAVVPIGAMIGGVAYAASKQGSLP